MNRRPPQPPRPQRRYPPVLGGARCTWLSAARRWSLRTDGKVLLPEHVVGHLEQEVGLAFVVFRGSGGATWPTLPLWSRCSYWWAPLWTAATCVVPWPSQLAPAALTGRNRSKMQRHLTMPVLTGELVPPTITPHAPAPPAPEESTTACNAPAPSPPRSRCPKSWAARGGRARASDEEPEAGRRRAHKPPQRTCRLEKRHPPRGDSHCYSFRR